MALHSLTVDTARVSTGGWRGSPKVAYLVPLSSANTLTPTTLERIRTRLRDDGYLEVVTAAVGPTERDRFLTDGFVDHEHLHLLSHDLHGLHDLHDLPPARPAKHRKSNSVARAAATSPRSSPSMKRPLTISGVSTEPASMRPSTPPRRIVCVSLEVSKPANPPSLVTR